jgi:hypothetical protein
MKTATMRQYVASAPHDASCLTPLFGEMAAAMLAGADRGRH